MTISQAIKTHSKDMIQMFGNDWLNEERRLYLNITGIFLMQDSSLIETELSTNLTQTVEAIMDLFEWQKDTSLTIKVLRVIRGFPNQTLKGFTDGVERYRQLELQIDFDIKPIDYARDNFSYLPEQQQMTAYSEALLNKYIIEISFRDFTAIAQTI